MVLKLVTLLVGLVMMVLVAVFVYLHQLSLPSLDFDGVKQVLVVFPHADDEALSSSGLVARLVDGGAEVTLLFLTKGERGTPDASLDLSLKQVRSEEARQVAEILGVTRLVHEDFGDGELVNKQDLVRSYLEQLRDGVDYDAVITFDPSGLYGHPDHVVTSRLTTEVFGETARLWYVSYPERMLGAAELPEHMAEDDSYVVERKYPTHKLLVWRQLVSKIKVLYAYRSQHEAFKSNYPPFTPLWLMTLFTSVEYYHVV